MSDSTPTPTRAPRWIAALTGLALAFGGALVAVPAYAEGDAPVEVVEPATAPEPSADEATAPEELPSETAPADDETPAEEAPAAPESEEPVGDEPGLGAPFMMTMDAEEPAPTVTVSKTTGLAWGGETITVSGTGFVNAGAATTGTRPPLSGKFTGAYIVFGKFADTWKPSDNAASSARFGIETRWGVLAEDLATIGGAGAGGVVIAADGTFSVTMTVAASIANDLRAGNYGVYTYAGGGAKHAPFETYTPIEFAAPAPQVLVSKTSGLAWDGETITVSGTGFVNAGAATTGTRPPLSGKFTGAYVAFGKFLDTWKPTDNAPSSARKTLVTKWAVLPEDVATIGGEAAGAVALGTNGSFSFTIQVSASIANDLLAGNYGIYSYPGGGAKYAPFETYTPIEFAAPAPQVFVSKTTGLDPDGETITVSGTGFVNAGAATTGTRPPLSGKFTGAYVVFGKFLDAWKPTDNAPSSARKTLVTKWAVLPADLATIGGEAAGGVALGTNGSFSFTIEVSATEESDLLAGNYGIYSYPGGGAKYAPFETYTPIAFTGAESPTDPGTGPGTPTDPGTPGTPGTSGPSLSISPTSVPAGQAARITVSGSGYTGAGAADGVYVVLGSSSLWQPGQALPADGWIALAWVTPGQISGGSWSTTLTVPAGALVAGGSYGIGTSAAHGLSQTDRSLDRWASLTIGTGQAAPVALLQPGETRTPAAAPPATSGVSVLGQLPPAGGLATWTASGFQPNEAGIIVVIYSDPVVLGTVTADANGVATWTGRLPATLTGTHTFTFQGSVSRGAVVHLQPAPVVSASACTVDDATLTWGFKESFRAYLTSSIANGEWTPADGASYQTPSFSWSGTGSLDADGATGDLAFRGSVRFTGHSGALDTTIANPRIVLTASGAELLLDVSGTTQDGTPVDAHGVEFATLDLSGVVPESSDGTLTWTAVPAVLTAAGSAAFGTYAEGEELDPVTLSVVLSAACGQAAGVEETAAPEVAALGTGAPSGADLGWIWWLVGGLVLLAIVVAIVVTVVRRRGAA
ncbi:MAG: hypothetical protein BGO95_09090 [Micrococcales bacterium 73-13]|nr:MAG: hypothetical protein BGO95_09090 [Micrococcales bacterium 73-13]